MLLLKEHIMFPLTSSLAKNMFEICSLLDVRWILTEREHQKTDFEICYDKCIRFLASTDFYNQHPMFTFTNNNLSLLHAAYENGM